jgi:lipopolysaccharide transport system permease protein
MLNILLATWRYRHFILSSIRSELITRFSRSYLGGLWIVIHPLMQAAIFALVLSEVMAAKMPGMATNKFAYAIYLMSGMLGWSLFTEVISRCLTLFIDNGNLLKKIVFPRLCLPLIVMGSALVNSGLLFFAILCVFGLLGHWPGIHIFWVPLLLLITLTLAVSIGLILGILNVFMRDIGQVIPIVLQIGFWFTPIVYSTEVIPKAFQKFLTSNPLLPLVQGLQNAMLYNTPPDIAALSWVFLAAILLLGFAMTLFRRASPEMVDVL